MIFATGNRLDLNNELVLGYAYLFNDDVNLYVCRNLGLTGALFTEASLNGFLQLNSIGLVLASTAPRAGY